MKKFKTPSKYLTAVSSNGGRPKLLLNEEGKQMVEVLAGFFCTDEDIADTLCTSVDLLTNKNNRDTFAEAKKRGLGKAKVSLRRKQFALADKNATMAIFLGKQYLGQRDYFEVEDTTANEKLNEILDGIRNNAQRQTK